MIAVRGDMVRHGRDNMVSGVGGPLTTLYPPWKSRELAMIVLSALSPFRVVRDTCPWNITSHCQSNS